MDNSAFEESPPKHNPSGPTLEDGDVAIKAIHEEVEEKEESMTRGQIVTISILCFVNIINYMDRYTIAAVLNDIGDYWDLTDAQMGLLQTAFLGVYMFAAPVFGYLGDRYNRKILLLFGIFLWNVAMMTCSFMPTYGSFLLMRCLVGIGEATYTPIAPTIISDTFVKTRRSKMLAFFYLSIPVGGGLGYIVGGGAANIAENMMSGNTDEAWRWALRVTPFLGLIAFFLILFLLKEPPRGEKEGATSMTTTSFWEDLKNIFSNKTYLLTTAGATTVAFVVGALAWWMPAFLEDGTNLQEDPNVNPDRITLWFGATAALAGLIGVPLGAYLGRRFRVKYPPADTIVCGCGLAFALPLVVITLLLGDVNSIGMLVAALFAQILLNLNWAVVADIVLYVTIPIRRSSATAYQILVSHALGDAISPYIVGVVADAFRPIVEENADVSGDSNTTDITQSQEYIDFQSLQYSMLLITVVELLGAIFFIWGALYLEKDKKKCDEAIAEASEQLVNANEKADSKNGNGSISSAEQQKY